MLDKIKKGFINVSKNLYPNDYINLARIDKTLNILAFDENTIFLSEEEKKKLNSDKIENFDNMVVVFKLNDSWGIICNIPIKYYKEKKILCHELVLPDVVQRMLSNFHWYNSEANPVMLTHNKKIDLADFVKSNLCDFKYNNTDIELFIYTNEKADFLLDNFKDIQVYYIADGHHRLFTTSVYVEKKEIMACIYEMDQLRIETIPRKITGISQEKFDYFSEKIRKRFKIIENDKKLEKGEIRLTFNNDKLTFKLWNVEGDLFANNDIYRLNTQVISNIFRIFKDEEIEYISESQLKPELKLQKENILYIESSAMDKMEFIETVENDNIMPPKSTYFAPKFPSFLVFNYFKKD